MLTREPFATDRSTKDLFDLNYKGAFTSKALCPLGIRKYDADLAEFINMPTYWGISETQDQTRPLNIFIEFDHIANACKNCWEWYDNERNDVYRECAFFHVILSQAEKHIGPGIWATYAECVLTDHGKAKTIRFLKLKQWIVYHIEPPIGARSNLKDKTDNRRVQIQAPPKILNDGTTLASKPNACKDYFVVPKALGKTLLFCDFPYDEKN